MIAARSQPRGEEDEVRRRRHRQVEVQGSRHEPGRRLDRRVHLPKRPPGHRGSGLEADFGGPGGDGVDRKRLGDPVQPSRRETYTRRAGEPAEDPCDCIRPDQDR